jgi:outer membrane protein assembly factor BamD (BamD/ComL family)
MRGMKVFATTLVLVVLVLGICSSTALAQGPAKPMAPPRNSTMEVAARHNLDVARWYLVKRKAYEGARDRLQEIIDTYPEFSRIDEVVFLMGEAQLKLKKDEKAVEYYNKLLKEYPESEFAKKARERLDEMKVATEKK